MKACQRNKPCDTFPKNSKGQCTADTCAYYTKGAALVDTLDEIKVGSPCRGNVETEHDIKYIVFGDGLNGTLWNFGSAGNYTIEFEYNAHDHETTGE